MSTMRVILGFLLVVIVTAVLVVALARVSRRPNIVLITVDTLRADHLGVYGYDRRTSPNIDALAASGVVFENAFTQATHSAPSHATLMTSLHAPVHGVIHNAVSLDDQQTTLAEILQAAGYETAMFVSFDALSAEFGFDQGFSIAQNHPISFHGPDHLHADPPETQEPPDSVFNAALEWLARPKSRPFFMWIHAQHPHKSYDPPPPYDRLFGDPPPSRWDLRCMNTVDRHMDGQITLDADELEHVVALYDGEVAFVDAQLGRIFSELRRLGLEDDTLVIVTADHGEMLFDDAERRAVGHWQYRYEPVLLVPLIMRGPRATPGGRRVKQMVGLIDLAPTILEIAGVIPPSVLRGESLAPLLDGRNREFRSANHTCTFHTDGIIRLSIRTTHSKLICDKERSTWTCQYYDLRRDPDEHADLNGSPEHAQEIQRLRRTLEAWFQGIVKEGQLGEVKPLNQRARSILRRAGYLRNDGET